jgi:hypothetical protein
VANELARDALSLAGTVAAGTIDSARVCTG